MSVLNCAENPIILFINSTQFLLVDRILEGRDPDYQKLAVKGLIGSSKRVLPATKNEEKIKAIKEAVGVLEDFLMKFDEENRSKLNLAYLPANVVTSCGTPDRSLSAEFVKAYTIDAKGNYKHLRTMFPKGDDSKSWDIVRNAKLKALNEKIAAKKSKLFNEDGSPSTEHLQLIYWAYSPQPDKVKQFIAKKEKAKASKRKSTTTESSSSEGSSDNASPAKKVRSK